MIGMGLVITGAVVSRGVDGVETIVKGHGFSMHGDLKYGRHFKHLEYVNPHAPKGGALRLALTGSVLLAVVVPIGALWSPLVARQLEIAFASG